MPNSASLLISILVRYPEIGTINFNPKLHLLKFTFLLARVISEQEYRSFRRKLTLSVKVHSMLENRRTYVLLLKRTTFDDLTVIELVRDVNTLSSEEISLVIELFQDAFGDILVTDHNDSLVEEDPVVQEELIQHMLEDLRESRHEKSLVAFREEGRVLVFNK